LHRHPARGRRALVFPARAARAARDRLSIPLSLFFAIITLHILGRTLNIVSLAGLAFSTGIVIDAALIVQGNVIRFLQEGKSALRATARWGCRGHAGVVRVDDDERRDLPAESCSWKGSKDSSSRTWRSRCRCRTRHRCSSR
jgi:hypothetical protein